MYGFFFEIKGIKQDPTSYSFYMKVMRCRPGANDIVHVMSFLQRPWEVAPEPI